MKNYKAFNLTSRGSYHIDNSIVCQDASSSGAYHNRTFAVVCDGHGGDDYVRSHIGSYFAKEAVVKCFSDNSLFTYFENASCDKEKNEILLQLEKSIVSEWNDRVREHYSLNPFTSAELSRVDCKVAEMYAKGEFIEQAYGTTLIAAGVTEKCWFCLHIGDGKCVVFDKNEQFTQPVPWDERCFLNNTTSLCDFYAVKYFRHYFSDDVPLAIFLATDGVDNSFADEKALNGFYELILSSFKIMPFQVAVDELAGYIPVLSSKGSGDDISIASVISTKLIQ